MKKLFLIAISLIFICACASSEDDVTIYRILKDEYMQDGQILVEESLGCIDGETELTAILRGLGEEAVDTRCYNPLANISILSFSLSDGTATVTLDNQYLVQSSFNQTLISACLCLSLSQIEGIERVSVAVDGNILVSDVSVNDILLYSSELSNEEEVCLYFANEARTLLIAEYRSLSLDDSTLIERYIVGELLRGTGDSNLHSPIPEGTTLIGVNRTGSNCTINLSQEFLDNKPSSPTEEILAVYSLVNSLTSLNDVSSVQILVEGQVVDKYLNLSLSNPLEQLDLIYLQNSQDSTETRLFFGYGDKIFGVPCLVSSDEDLAQSVLDKLSSADSFGTYSSLFSAKDELTHVRTNHGVCTVSVSLSFFEWRNSDEASLALDALIRTMLELDGISSVLICYPDNTVPLAPYRDLSLAQRNVLTEIIE